MARLSRGDALELQRALLWHATHLSIGPNPALLKADLVSAVGGGEVDDP